MTHDAKLVEAMKVINASGTHWVAPWRQTRPMIEVALRAEPLGPESNDAIDFVQAEYEAQRDIYLAEQKGKHEVETADAEDECSVGYINWAGRLEHRVLHKLVADLRLEPFTQTYQGGLNDRLGNLSDAHFREFVRRLRKARRASMTYWLAGGSVLAACGLVYLIV
jgi:hypothetical protein